MSKELVKPTILGIPQTFSLDSSAPTSVLADEINKLLNHQRNTSVVQLLLKCSEDTGSVVKVSSEYNYMPVLIDSNDKPVTLYSLLQVLDEITDFESLKENFPNLSYKQLDGFMTFLRKLLQFNTEGIDIDELEDDTFLNDNELLSQLRRAIKDKESVRVLNED